MNTVLITGAAGFIGRTLADRLRADGATVRGVDFGADPEREIVAGDIAARGAWQDAATGCDTVIHTAAIVSNAASIDDAWRANVLGTRNVLDAAVAAGARRFVHFSSVRAFGDTGFPDGVDERWPVRPDGHTYVDTKIASEQVVLQAHAAGEIECTVIRPGDVYGPGSRPWTILPVEAIAAGRFFLPAMGRGVHSPVYVDDLATGVLAAARSDAAAGQVLTISGGIGISCNEFFGHYARMLGKPPARRVPTKVAMLLAAIPETAAWLTGSTTELRRSSVLYMTRTGTYSIAKARRVLGWEPAVDVAEGMRRTEEWLRVSGHLAG
ncbi:MAG: NAD-dependent epimerase/dehydratase family protein [Solirubrobacterales bacterium]